MSPLTNNRFSVSLYVAAATKIASEKSIPITVVPGLKSANHFALYPRPQPASSTYSLPDKYCAKSFHF